MEMLAQVRIVMWEGASLWLIDATKAKGVEPRTTDFHAHHAIQVVLGLGGWFRLNTAEAQAHGDAVAVAADIEHVFEAEGLIAMLFVEPESQPGRAIALRFFCEADLIAVPPGIFRDIRERMAAFLGSSGGNDSQLVELGRELVSVLGAGISAEAPDLRIRKVIAWAADHLDESIGLSDALAIGGLSASRLRHLFVEQTGLPFKTYLLWLRLTRAVEGIAAGTSLTQAAHEAGFADSAHLSRTFRRMFGVSPSALRII